MNKTLLNTKEKKVAGKENNNHNKIIEATRGEFSSPVNSNKYIVNNGNETNV